MAQSYQSDFGLLVVPQAAVNINIVSQPNGLVANGILFLVGEAAEGPAWQQETSALDLAVGWGPGQSSQVKKKYGSGQLVDAFNAVVAASADPAINGSPSQIFTIKVNTGVQASLNLQKTAGGTYAPLLAQRAGLPGNALAATVTAKTVEVVPTTGVFTWINNVGAISISVRLNGGAATALSVGANTTPTALQALAWPAGTTASGGGTRSLLTSTGQTITGAVVSGNNVTFTISTSWANNPVVGDTLYIPTGSALASTGSANVGAYLVTSVTNSVVGATKLSDGPKGGAVAGVVTAPITTGSPWTVGATTDLQAFAPVTVAVNAGAVVDGIGKDLEIADTFNASGDLFARYAFQLNTNLATWTTGGSGAQGSPRNILGTLVAGQLSTGTVTNKSMVVTNSLNWVVQPQAGDSFVIPAGSSIAGAGNANVGLYAVTASTATTATVNKVQDLQTGTVPGAITTPVAVAATNLLAVSDVQSFRAADLVSASEYSVDLNLQRALDSLNEDVVAGGAIPLLIGYQGTTATLTITATTLTTAITGGSGANLNIPLANFSTIKDLATFINSQTGYTASPGTATLGQQNPAATLDDVTAVGICTSQNAPSGRIKMDAQSFISAVAQQSTSTVLGTPLPTLGLPTLLSQSFLAGGARGGSSTAQWMAAIDAIKSYVGNFVVPLISQNAVAPNAFGSTDILLGVTDSSSTYIASTVMAYVNTHCLLMSKAKTRRNRQGFASVRDSFVNSQTAAANIAGFRTSMTFQDVTVNGVQQQPWMAAAMAASMQAAGFYRPIVRKLINIQGAISAAGDYNSQDPDQKTAALLAGLLPLTKNRTGGWYWVSDQTTYGKDNTPIPNSIQAVYASDIIAVDLAESMENAFDGQSVADIGASGAKTFVESKFGQYKRLKLTAPSSDALNGFKNLSVLVSPPALAVSVEAKVATGIYYIPIQLYVSTVTQAANQ